MVLDRGTEAPPARGASEAVCRGGAGEDLLLRTVAVVPSGGMQMPDTTADSEALLLRPVATADPAKPLTESAGPISLPPRSLPPRCLPVSEHIGQQRCAGSMHEPPPPLEHIEQRAVSAAFLQQLTETHITAKTFPTAYLEAQVHYLERERRILQAYIRAGGRGHPSEDKTADLLAYSADPMAARGHARAGQRRSNVEHLGRELRQVERDLKRRADPKQEIKAIVTSRDVHSQLIKKQTDTKNRRFCELEELEGFGLVKAGRDKTDPVSGPWYFGKARFFLSYSWNSPWDEVVEALVTHAEKVRAAGEPEPYYWVDIFAVNQHDRLACARPKDCPGCAAVQADMHDWATADKTIPKGFDRVISHTEKTLVLMEPWDCPRPPTRVWCLFEANTTMTRRWCKPDKGVEMVLSYKEQVKLQMISLYGKDTDQDKQTFLQMLNVTGSAVAESFSVDARRADATQEDDREHIFAQIQQMDGGFDQLNRSFEEARRKWLAELALSLVDRLESPQDVDGFVHKAEERVRTCGPRHRKCLKALIKYPGLPASLCGAGLGASAIGCWSWALRFQLFGNGNPFGTIIWEIWPGLVMALVGCFGVRMQKFHLLHRPTICCGTWIHRRVADMPYILAGPGFVALLLGGAVGGLFGLALVGPLWLLCLAVMILSRSDRDISRQRAQSRVRAGWVQLRLADSSLREQSTLVRNHSTRATQIGSALKQFQNAHTALTQTFGNDDPAMFVAAPGLCTAYRRQNRVQGEFLQ